MGKIVTAKCKNCGKEFSYSEKAYKLASEKDVSRPERCNDCAERNISGAKSTGSPYFSFENESGEFEDFEFHKGEFFFKGGRTQKEETRKPDQSGMDISITDEEIVKLYQLLEENQVVVMVSPTGTGKSTYVPKRLLQAPDNYSGDFVDRLIRQGQVIVTQPRIMATDGTAKTTAKISGELFDRRGMFGIRHSKDKESFSAWNKCVSITDGTLPNWIQEGKLGQYSLIMVDEAHERSCNIDLILGFLKRELPKYPQLRVIISSATINAEKFLESFKEAGISCELFDIPSRKKFKKFEHFWQDESVSPKCSCWLCRKPAAKRREFWEKKKAPLGRYDLPEACANFALKILEETSQGSIIVFLDGASAIEDACGRIRSRCRKGIEVVPVYRERKDAKKELERTAGKRRVIVATNIAETSITIPDLVYCINSGWIKQVEWDPAIQAQRLESRLHSKDGNSQRGGRLGRNQDGYVYHLFTKQQWEEELEEHTSPEITRSCLDDSLTKLKAAGIVDAGQFPWMEKTDEWDSMAKEMQRADKSLLERGVTDSEGHVVEKALSLLRIPRSSTEASVLFSADEQGILFETLTVLMLMSDREGNPHTGSNLYDPFCGLLCWNSSWTAQTKSKVWAIHQGLKIGCRDDLDFVVKLAFCFKKTESNGLSKEWADYHCVNFRNLGRIVSEIRELTESLGEEREESLREMDFSNLEKVRALFLSAWPGRIINLISAGDQILHGSGPVSPYCAGNWEGAKSALAMAFVEEETVIGNLLQRFPTASFMVNLSGEDKSRDLFLDQRFPVGSWVETKKKQGKTFLAKLSEIPAPLSLKYRKDIWSEEKPEVSMPFEQSFIHTENGEEPIPVEGIWLGKEKAERARIVRWTEEDGSPFAILSQFSELDSQKFGKKQGDSIRVKIHRILRDPLGKRGWALARTSESETPVELSELSLSDWGAGLELIEGKTVSLDIKDFDADGFSQLSNIAQIIEDLSAIRKEISEKNTFPGYVVEINEEEENTTAVIVREDRVVHPFEIYKDFVPGRELSNLKISEEVIVSLSLPKTEKDHIQADRLTEEEINDIHILKNWEYDRGKNEVSFPYCLKDNDFNNWPARPEAIDFVKRHSWRYCLQARIISLKRWLSKLNEGSIVKAVVKKIKRKENGENGEIVGVQVILEDGIPGFVPVRFLFSVDVSEGDALSLLVKSVDPVTGLPRLIDKKKETENQRKREEWVQNQKDYILSLKEQIRKIEATISKNKGLRSNAISIVWKERYDQWIAEGQSQVVTKEKKIRDVQRSINE